MRACAVRRGARRERGRGGGAREKRSSLARWLLRSRHLGGGLLLSRHRLLDRSALFLGVLPRDTARKMHSSPQPTSSGSALMPSQRVLCAHGPCGVFLPLSRALPAVHGRLGAHYRAGRKEVAQRPGEELNKRGRKKVRRGRGARGRAGREGRGEGRKEEGRMRRREGLQALVRGARPERRGGRKARRGRTSRASDRVGIGARRLRGEGVGEGTKVEARRGRVRAKRRWRRQRAKGERDERVITLRRRWEAFAGREGSRCRSPPHPIS